MQMSGYVMQDSAFLENMTVRETIRDSLRFRNDPACYEGKEEEIVQNIIDVMRYFSTPLHFCQYNRKHKRAF